MRRWRGGRGTAGGAGARCEGNHLLRGSGVLARVSGLLITRPAAFTGGVDPPSLILGSNL
jgi:hypothetical protein